MPEPEKLIYFDNAATTYPKPECVYQAADQFYRCYGGNAGRGANPLARKGAELIAETRSMLSAWLGAPSPEQIVFTPSATVALNLAILGTELRHGDVVYVTPFEHNSVLRPLEHLRQAIGVVVQQMPFDPYTMACQFDRLAAQFGVDPPALVCVTQASNVCGTMPPVLEMARVAKDSNPNAVVIVDGAQVAGLYPLPLGDGVIDTHVFSGHKSLYGPYGVAGLVLATDWRPVPLLFGGTGTSSESVQMPFSLPSAYEAGSHNVWAIAGLRAALEWLQEKERKAVVMHTLQLAERMRDRLMNLPGVQVYVPLKDAPWCGIVSFNIEDVVPQAVETALGAKGFAVRAGLHCAPWTHRYLGTTANGGTVRVSVGQFNSVEEVERLLETIQSICPQANAGA